MRLGIGRRLTAWYTLTVVAVLAASSIVMLAGLRLLLYREAFAQVSNRAQALATLVAAPRPTGGEHDTEPRRRPALTDPELVAVDASNAFVQVTDPHGGVINRSANLGAASLPVTPSLAAPAQVVRTSTVAAGAPLAWTSVPLSQAGSVVGAVQVAVSLAGPLAFLADVRRILIWVDAGAALLAAAVGYLLARQALGPVRAIVAAARRLDGAHLDERLPETGPRDEIRELASVFNGALQRIAAAVRAQRDLVAVASHELRTPLAIIQGYADAILRREPEPDGETEQAAVVIREEAARMRRMASRLLVLARGQVTERSRWSQVDLAALATDVQETMQVIATDRALSVEAPGPVWVAGDAERLQQAIVIMVDNALKYTHPGGHVWIRAAAAPRPAVEVRDDGPGMSAEVQARLFEPFFRGDPAHSRARDGFGLGLSIAQVIAREHGGEIEVESRRGEGSTLRLVLPAAGPESGGARREGTPGR